ncbi:3-phosphoglycerate dehydrogenase [Rhodoplanes elegans]|uniref:3-phosphoglycerate dehydrogenase n=1 Tax=Rhodoplanes elegans TaxID=29408 RepID=A0A327KTZ3_9BRAD|nr:tripartite tricarboxylate transporter substrate binding protein [Rhodoplanes elegans]MBK5958445.1 3-phosphoglycerate dehydrogenase [Rhodoplanes elegans]RAI41133.1 3-phosphoglycerate dehydrogenase [Rhodoplanes elegans]
MIATRRTFLELGLAGTTTALLGTGPARAAWPEKPITMIVAYAPGGSTDLTARVLATYLEKYIGGGAKIAVVNRPGAGGEIGFTALSESTPDGYTIGFLNTPNVLSIPIERTTKFNWRQYELLGNLLDDPGGFSVHVDSPIKSLKDLVAYAKEKPGAVTVGTTGVGSDDHLAMMAFERLTGTKLTHVPFAGASAVRNALVGKHIVLGAINIGEAKQYVAGGSPFRNLGQMSVKRVNIAEDTPTFMEQGFDMVFASMRGVGAPKGIPAELRDRLVDAVAKTAADPEFVAKVAGIYAPMRFLPPAAYAAELAGVEANLQQMWKDTPWNVK